MYQWGSEAAHSRTARCRIHTMAATRVQLNLCGSGGCHASHLVSAGY